MNKLTIVILCLALISLACLTTSGPYWTPGPETPAPTITTDEPAAGAVYELPVITATAAQRTCARVIALDALNLRKGPSEKDIVLAWLKNNDIVVVVDQSNADWWHIESAVYSGYARAIYLQESECE